MSDQKAILPTVFCVKCLAPGDTWPMAYRGDPWCSDNCHKRVAETLGVSQKTLTTKMFRETDERLKFQISYTSALFKKRIHAFVREQNAVQAAKEFGIDLKAAQAASLSGSGAQRGRRPRKSVQ